MKLLAVLTSALFGATNGNLLGEMSLNCYFDKNAPRRGVCCKYPTEDPTLFNYGCLKPDLVRHLQSEADLETHCTTVGGRGVVIKNLRTVPVKTGEIFKC